MHRIVVKVGSNVLTTDKGKLDITRLSALVDQIAWITPFLLIARFFVPSRASHHSLSIALAQSSSVIILLLASPEPILYVSFYYP